MSPFQGQLSVYNNTTIIFGTFFTFHLFHPKKIATLDMKGQLYNLGTVAVLMLCKQWCDLLVEKNAAIGLMKRSCQHKCSMSIIVSIFVFVSAA